MPGFVYFVAREVHTPGRVRALGLPCLTDADGQLAARPVHAGGPEGTSSGTVIWHSAKDEGARRVQAGGQDWHKVSKGANGNDLDYWIGYDKGGALPVPADLAREDLARGEDVKLSGADWTVPVLHLLPQGIRWSPEGLVYQPQARFQDLVDRAMRYAKIRIGLEDGVSTVDDEWLLSLAIEILAINYRVSKPEVGILGMFDTVNFLRILDVACDLKAITGYDSKKNAGAGSSTGPSSTSGNADGTPATPRP